MVEKKESDIKLRTQEENSRENSNALTDQNEKAQGMDKEPVDDKDSNSQNSEDEYTPSSQNKENAAAGDTITRDSETDNIDEHKYSDEHEEEHEGDHEEDQQEEDFSRFSKEQLLERLDQLIKEKDYPKAKSQIDDLKHAYDELLEGEKKEAFEKFRSEEGDDEGFEFKPSEIDNQFDASWQLLRDRITEYYNDLNKQKEENYQRKLQILEKLREFVDSEETNASFKVFKEFQEQWKEAGPVPPQHNRSLWASYNALIDRFYDNRSIYFELKELDRKKNLEAKLELCERAEALANVENIKEAIKELNELHQEFKHIGPVPKDKQEPVWQRFKAASDHIYQKRKAYFSNLKVHLVENLEKKSKLAEEVISFAEFDSKIPREWNKKMKEILELQKKWESIGSLPRSKAREINRKFWSHFKTFFQNKNKFFKGLDAERQVNLEKKQKLLEQAEALKDSKEWNETAETLKRLQREWKEIGPVPAKFRNEIYSKFKSACDHFFDEMRKASGAAESSYKENLRKKEDIITKINKLAQAKEPDIENFEELQEEFSKIGFVPKSAISKTKEQFKAAINNFLQSVDVDEEERNKLRVEAQVNAMKGTPNAGRKIKQKEHALRKQISKVESDIATLNNNKEFFAETKKAQSLKNEFTQKLEEAEEELESLKEQLRILQDIT